MSQQPVILLATPCFGGLVHHGYMLSVCKLMQVAVEQGFELQLALLAGDALVTRARSVLVARLLDDPRVTHLLFIDADITFEPEQVMRLLRAGKDFAAAFYPLKAVDWDAVPKRVVGGEPLRSAGLSYVGTLLDLPERRTDGDFATARYAGTGFQLIKRTVLERLVAAHPELHFDAVHARAGSVPASANLYALFDCLIDPDTGVYLSEDYAFCRRWLAIGGEIWLDLKSRLSHTGVETFVGDASGRYAGSDIG